MRDLVFTQEKMFGVQRRKQRVEAGRPLGHSVVVCILGFKGKFAHSARDGEGTSGSATDAAIRGEPRKPWIPVLDKPQANVGTRAVGFWTAKNGLDEIVIEIRRPDSQLAAFQREDSLVVPGRLDKSSKS